MTTKNKTLAELAAMVGAEITGAPDLVISGLAELSSAGNSEITFLVKASRVAALDHCRAAAVIVPMAVTTAPLPLLRVKNPYLAAAAIQNWFQAKPFSGTGISTMAHIGNDCQLPAAISIGPMAVLGDRVIIGERVTIGAGAVIGDDVHIGDDCLIHANVTIYQGCRLGSRIIIHSGTVIGCDGFGFATDEKGCHLKWPHVGIVRIDDDVEIGSCVTIDRATFGETRIRQGARLDNLIQIAHNVVVGENSVLAAQVGIAGSSTLGRNVVLGGQVGINGHIHLADRTMVAAKSGVANNTDKADVISGFPAIQHRDWLKAATIFARLPQFYKEFRELKEKVAKIYQELFKDEQNG